MLKGTSLSSNKILCSLAMGLTLQYTPVMAAVIAPGDLFISEIMANPALVTDGNGEWFELYNGSSNAIDLNGFVLSDTGSNSHIIDNGGALLIGSGDYLVLGNNGDSLTNGNYTPDYVFSGFTLGNADDEIILSFDGAEIVRLDYFSSSFIGTSGISAELSNTALLSATDADYFLTPNTFVYGDGDIGSPGGPGSMPLIPPATVPVPAAVWLFGTGLVMLTGIGRRRSETANRPKIAMISTI